MDAVVRAEDVRREYGETVALDGVSLSVGAGEVLALVGPNGAGKTTLVRALTGTIEHEGSVSLFGDDPQAVTRSRIGLLPQSFAPPDRLTARELIHYYGGLYDESRSTDEVLADVGLSDTADTRYANLSGGQRRRTCVGTALVNDPDLLVLDEPTTGIDPAGRRALWGLLSGLAAAGTTILLTTHYMEEAEHLADRVGLLADGRLATTGSPADLVAEHGGENRLVVDLARETAPEPIVRALGDAGFAASGADGSGTEPSLARGATGSNALVVRDIDPEHIGEVVDVLDGAGATYDGLEWSQPDLEDVYLALTGTAMTGPGDGRAGTLGDRDGNPDGDRDRDATDRDGDREPADGDATASTEARS